MRLPNDFDESNNGMTPTVISAIVAVTFVVGAILAVVLIMNRQPSRHRAETPAEAAEDAPGTQPGAGEAGHMYPDTDELLSGSTLSPDDFDFWDKYPVETPASQTEEQESGATEAPAENDPATDGRHTLVLNRDGREEWVLISPYLPKHEYDFTKLVCQSNLMKYYEEGRQVSFVGADISKYQDYVDFVKLKKAGINFVMLRVGARGYGSGQLVSDDYFTDNIKRATDAGLQVGVYFSSQAITAEEAVEEANMVLTSLADYHIGYPVAYDMSFVDNDTARIEVLSKKEKTDIAKTFLDTVAAAGYKAMLYGDKEWLIKEIDMSKLTAYDVWLSQPGDVPDFPYRFTMWQYTSDAAIDGIAGYTGLNISFIDYSEK